VNVTFSSSHSSDAEERRHHFRNHQSGQGTGQQSAASSQRETSLQQADSSSRDGANAAALRQDSLRSVFSSASLPGAGPQAPRNQRLPQGPFPQLVDAVRNPRVRLREEQALGQAGEQFEGIAAEPPLRRRRLEQRLSSESEASLPGPVLGQPIQNQGAQRIQPIGQDQALQEPQAPRAQVLRHSHRIDNLADLFNIALDMGEHEADGREHRVEVQIQVNHYIMPPVADRSFDRLEGIFRVPNPTRNSVSEDLDALAELLMRRMHSSELANTANIERLNQIINQLRLQIGALQSPIAVSQEPIVVRMADHQIHQRLLTLQRDLNIQSRTNEDDMSAIIIEQDADSEVAQSFEQLQKFFNDIQIESSPGNRL